MKKKYLALILLGAITSFSIYGCGNNQEENNNNNINWAEVVKNVISIEKTDTNGNVDTYTVTCENGYSFSFQVTNGLNGEQGIQGEPGEDGHTPVITIGENGNWVIDGVDTGISSKGEKGDTGEKGDDGLTPYIGDNGNWWIGETDTGVKAEGSDGEDGQTPYIGENGNWWIGEEDTGVKASGDSSETKQEYTITFDGNGGLIDGKETYSIKANEGETLTELPTATRDGYYFLGWFTGDGVNDGQFTTVTPVTHDFKLFARWEKIRYYQVVWQNFNHTVLEVDQNVPAHTLPEYNGVTPTLTSLGMPLTFIGWDYDLEAPVESNLTITAMYEEINSYVNITFDVGEYGSLYQSVYTYRFGSSVNEPEIDMANVPDDKIFAGWYRDPNFSERVNFGAYLARQDETFYGRWIDKYWSFEKAIADGELGYIICIGEDGNPDAMARTQGAEEAIKEICDSLGIADKLLEEHTCVNIDGTTWSEIAANNFVTRAVHQYSGQLDLIISNNDGMAIAASSATGLQDGIPIFGFDGLTSACEMIEQGILAGSVTQNGDDQALLTTVVLGNLLKGETDYSKVTTGYNGKAELNLTDASKHILQTQFTAITKANADELKPGSYADVKEDPEIKGKKMLIVTYSNNDNFIEETYRAALPYYAEALGFETMVIEGDGFDDADLQNRVRTAVQSFQPDCAAINVIERANYQNYLEIVGDKPVVFFNRQPKRPNNSDTADLSNLTNVYYVGANDGNQAGAVKQSILNWYNSLSK